MTKAWHNGSDKWIIGTRSMPTGRNEPGQDYLEYGVLVAGNEGTGENPKLGFEQPVGSIVAWLPYDDFLPVDWADVPKPVKDAFTVAFPEPTKNKS